MPASKSKKGRKIGRNKNKPSHKVALSQNRIWHHKVEKIEQHIEGNEADKQSYGALQRIKEKFPRIY